MYEPAKTDRFLRVGDVVQLTSLSQATVYRYVAKGLFPRPTKMRANGASRWPESAVHAWIEQKKAEALN